MASLGLPAHRGSIPPLARGNTDTGFDATHRVAFLQKNRAADGKNP